MWNVQLRGYLKSYQKMITHNRQVLLPVPIYIDGAVTGQFSDLPITAVKLALGIHKRETRDKDHAWREIGWIPQVRQERARGKKLFKDTCRNRLFRLATFEPAGMHGWHMVLRKIKPLVNCFDCLSHVFMSQRTYIRA